MITGDLKSKVDKLWTTFWNNGISNPLSVIEQISYLLFIKRLDDLELLKEKKAQRLNRPLQNPTFGPGQQHIRWSRFKNLDDSEEMLRDHPGRGVSRSSRTWGNSAKAAPMPSTCGMRCF
jgi:type I restriction enzyme M protein